MINCIICKKEIVKYEQDVDDTVCLKQGYVCDKCSKEIAQQRIDR